MSAYFRFLSLFIILLFLTSGAVSQPKMVKVLVSTPYIGNKAYRPVADVMVGSIIRELNRAGGMEVIDRKKSEQYLREQGFDEWIHTRDLAIKVGGYLGADIVIYSTVDKRYDNFIYAIILIEVDRNIIQRTLNGSFLATASASEIGKVMKEESEKLMKYIPLPSELEEPTLAFRIETVDPLNLPGYAEIENLPPMDRFGELEQVMSYYRVFPGEQEYHKLEQQNNITRFVVREEIDEEMSLILNKFYMYGDFVLKYDLQAFLIKDCSTRAVNVCIANKIPVFISDGIIIGYSALIAGGHCIFKMTDGRFFDSDDFIHRKRVAVFIIFPKPGSPKGIPKDYIEKALSYYPDEWGKTPTLVEIKESMFDIISSGME